MPKQPAHVNDLLPRHPRAEKRIVVRDVSDPGVGKVMTIVHICILVFCYDEMAPVSIDCLTGDLQIQK